MIAVIVIGIIIILTILLVILKTYNRRTHASRVLGGSSKPRQKKMSSSTVQTSIPMGNMGLNSISGSLAVPNRPSENGFRIPRVDLRNLDANIPESLDNIDSVNNAERFSTTSGSTVITIHDTPSLGNT